MSNLIKTTITVPEDLLDKAKFRALQEKKTLSMLIRESLYERVFYPIKEKKKEKKKDPTSFLGAFHIGITKIYNKRSDLYERHLKRKMGY